MENRCHRLPSRSATSEELKLIHADSYLETMKNCHSMKQRALNIESKKYGDVFLCPDSMKSASLSAGCGLQLISNIEFDSNTFLMNNIEKFRF